MRRETPNSPCEIDITPKHPREQLFEIAKLARLSIQANGIEPVPGMTLDKFDETIKRLKEAAYNDEAVKNRTRK